MQGKENTNPNVGARKRSMNVDFNDGDDSSKSLKVIHPSSMQFPFFVPFFQSGLSSNIRSKSASTDELLNQYICQKFENSGISLTDSKDPRTVENRNLQVKHLHKLIDSLVNESIRNRKGGRSKIDAFDMSILRKSKEESKWRDQFSSRIAVAESVLCELFKCLVPLKAIVLLAIWHKGEAFKMIREVFEMNLERYEFSPKQVLDMHFRLGKFSYSRLFSIGSSLRKVSEGFVRFDTPLRIREYRDSLHTGRICIFENPSGKRVGRLWPLEDMVQRLLENDGFLKRHRFFIHHTSTGNEAEFLMNSHIDGTTSTSYASLLNAVSRPMGLGELATHPGALLINAMEEGKEDIATVFKIFRDGMWSGLKQFNSAGCWAKCMDPIVGKDCQLCEAGIKRELMKALDSDELIMKHKCSYSHTYTLDGKMVHEMLPLMDGRCHKCVDMLRAKEHNLEENLVRKDSRILSQLVQAHHGFEEAYQTFKKQNQRNLPHDIVLNDNVTADGLTFFYESKEFANFQAKFGAEYKGTMSDLWTPLEHYITDTLHLCIIMANLVFKELVVPLVQQIEDSIPGLGPHALFVALKAAGFRNHAMRLLQCARTKYKSKLVSFSTCKSSGTVGLTIPKAIIEEFKRMYLPKLPAQRARLQQIFSRFMPRNTPGVVAKKKRKELLDDLLFLLDTLDFRDVQTHVITIQEYRAINNSLALRKAEKFVSESEKIDAAVLAKESGIDLQGRDAMLMFLNGGELLIRHLNLFLVQGHLQHNEALEKQIKRLTRNEEIYEGLESEHKALLHKVLDIKNMNFDTPITAHEFEADLQNLFSSAVDIDEEMAEYQQEAVTIGKEIIKLYEIDGNPINLDPKCKQVLQIFSALRDVLLPIIKPCSENQDAAVRKEQLIRAMDNHDERILKFIQELQGCREYQFKFGPHSDYMHWLMAHAKSDYQLTLEKWNLHISFFSCQTSEHFNKVSKCILQYLHGFTTRSMSAAQPWKNKFGFLMHEYMLRVLYYIHTLQRPQHQHCRACGNPGHNRRTCKSNV